MNALAEKMKAAGVDTIGARLTTACTEAIRLHPNNAREAWRCAGEIFGHEFMRGLMNDMQAHSPAKEEAPSKAFEKISAGLNDALDMVRSAPPSRPISSPAPYKPRVIPQERLETRRRLQEVVRSKYKNSEGTSWSDVSCHEATALMQDGKEATALLAACPAAMPNDGRTFGDVLGIKRTDEIIAAVRNAKPS